MSLNLGTMYVAFDADMTSFHTKAKAFGSTLEGIGSKAKSLGTSISLGITAPATIAAGIGVAAFTSFDASMRNVNTIAKLSQAEFEATGETVKSLAVELGKQPTGLADSLYDIYSSGFSGAQALDLLKVSTVAASAGLASAKDASGGIMAVLNAYGLSASEAGDVSDIFFKTVEKGVTTFPELASGVGNVISTASMLGVKFEEVGAALATMTKGGINTAESVTALNAMFMRMIEGSDEMNAAFKKEVGTTASLYLQTKGLGATVEVLSKITAGSADEFKRLGFQTRDFKAAASLSRQEGKAFAADLADIANKANRTGAAQAAFNEQTKSLAHTFEKTKAIVTVAAIELGQTLAPILVKINGYIQQAIIWWRGLGDGTKNVIVTMVAAAAAAGPMLLIFGKFATAISAFAPLLTGVLVKGAGLVRWFMRIGSFGGVITTVWTAVVGFTSAIASMALPIIAVIAAVVGIGAALISAYGEGDTFRAKMADVWGTIVTWAQGAWEAIKAFTVGAIGFFANFGENLGLLWGWLKDNWRNLLSDMVQLVILYVSNTISNFLTLFEKIGAVAGVFVGWLKDNWQQIGFDLIDALLGVLIKVGEVTRSIGKAIWDGIVAGLSGEELDMNIFERISESFKKGMTQKGTLGQRLSGMDLLGDFKGPFEGFQSSMTALPDLNLEFGKAKAPVEALAGSLDKAATAQEGLGEKTKKTGEAMQELWKGAEAATAGSAEAAKAIVRHLGSVSLANTRAGAPGPSGASAGASAALPGAVPTTASAPRDDAAAVADDKVYRTASLAELTAIRNALERIGAVMIGEAEAAA